MKLASWIFGLLLLATVSLAQHDDMQAPGHADGYSGRAVIETVADRIMVALDEDGDGITDRVFDFFSRAKLTPERVESDVEIEFWHDGMSVKAGNRVFVLSVIGAADWPKLAPRPRARWIGVERDKEAAAISVRRIAGTGLIATGSNELGTPDEAIRLMGSSTPMPEPPGGTNSCAKSCSVSCRRFRTEAPSSCQAQCSEKATCFCDEAGEAICWCSSCH